MRAMSGFRLAVLLLAAALSMASSPVFAASPQDRIFTVAKYPVDATAANAVTAKREALDEGRKAAFRSLLKRLLPADYYPQVPALLSQADPASMIAAMRVDSEESSATQYIATLDFSFDPDSVRALLQQAGIPFVDQPAPPALLLAHYTAPDANGAGAAGALSQARGGQLWRSVWAGLDLANALAPLQLAPASTLSPADLGALKAADPEGLARTARALRTALLVVAEARPDPGAGKLHVTLAGQDAAGRFSIAATYQLDKEDVRYSLELAAVIAQGMLETRWKMALRGPGQATAAVSGGAPTPLQLVAEFSSLAQWQRQQQVLAGTPGVTELQIGGVSGRSASIALVFPGGGPALQSAIASRGLNLENINGFWVLR